MNIKLFLGSLGYQAFDETSHIKHNWVNNPNSPRSAAHFKVHPRSWWPQFRAHRAAHLEPPVRPSRAGNDITKLPIQRVIEKRDMIGV